MGRNRSGDRQSAETERRQREQDEENRRRQSQYDDWLNEQRANRIESRGRAQRAWEDTTNQINDTRGYWRGIGETGGYDPADRARIEGDIDALRRYSTGESVTNADRARIRGGGVYDEYSKTGGWDDARKQNYRARAGSVIPSFFKNLGQKLEQQNRISGGYNPGYTSQTRAMARDASRQANEANIEAENYINESVDSGRRWGTEGMSRSEMALQGLLDNIRQGGMRAALAGSSDLYGNMSRNRIAAGQGLSESDRAMLGAAGGFSGLFGQDADLESRYLGASQSNQQHSDSTEMGWQDRMNQRYQQDNSTFWERMGPLITNLMSSGAQGAAGAYAGGANRNPNNRNTGFSRRNPIDWTNPSYYPSATWGS